ncbi:cobalt ECF transporter T component CbiQ [Craterilacuibacter sp. RT1T]|uniref:cobalt ECF transporter T component CbiQ n=1 Tax=Craterilacuibacter sp. RT1T TaxID=2942211 RepID=UPI0020BD581C|nr:cobalt ECF transporter T component CbiQ [Craterilacuibacter sp. RT1T]MCL6263190.1 cobalt ECF transporter T component CbiQ [Craterilacuibacter sp. RT1T]
MSTLDEALRAIRRVDAFAARPTLAAQLDARAKVIATLAVIIAAASFPPHALGALLPLLLFPAFLLAAADVPLNWLLGRLLFALPFAFFVGVLNPWLESATFSTPWGTVMSSGWLTFASILLRFAIAVSSVLLLLAGTGMVAVAHALSRLGLPQVFANQLLFLYRYVFVIAEELARSVRAYRLRAPNTGHTLPVRAYRLLLQGVLSRALERALRVHQAMLARGFDGTLHIAARSSWQWRDSAFVLFWPAYALLVRLTDIPLALGRLLTGA